MRRRSFLAAGGAAVLADPGALLMYNDYNIAGEDGSNAKSDAVYAWLQQMLDQGVPIDGVGDQGHLDSRHWCAAASPRAAARHR